MCGFVGVLSKDKAMVAQEIIVNMNNEIIHRGPDDSGTWSDESVGIALGHRRLSIVELSAAGHQPMISRSGRYVMVFNGEIYNHKILRNKLSIDGWLGGSDTETLLAAIERWGIDGAIKRSAGMFAFAVWDQKKCELTLGRDRLGEKPLYYGWQGDGENACFLFGSELKTLRVHPAFSPEVDRGALSLFMRYGCVPAPYCIYKSVKKLLPGHFLRVSFESPFSTLDRYWSMEEVVLDGVNNPINDESNRVVDGLEDVLRSSIRQQMLADVPVGAFLSGGVDSSTIVALMQAESSQRVKTFSIGFEESKYNEAPYARLVSEHLGTEHSELYVSSQRAMEVVPILPSIYCEPFADSSQIPTFLVSKLAGETVKVSLSGDGGDELFGGYNRYLMVNNVWKYISKLPIGCRMNIAHALKGLSPDTWDRIASPLQFLVPGTQRLANVGDKIHKALGVLGAADVDSLHYSLVSLWDPEKVVIEGREPPTVFHKLSSCFVGLQVVPRMMALDSITYLPDDILTKLDRATMAASLESRTPFLDHQVIEFASKIPQSMKLRNGIGKWILREVLYRYVPKQLIERPKMGFAVPIDAWLRGPLREWAEPLLNENRLNREGFFDSKVVRVKWLEHQSGKKNWQHLLWSVLMFQAWLDDQRRY